MEILGRLKPGDHIKTATVAKAQVGPGGAFALRIDPGAPIQEFMEDNGTANFTLVGEGAGLRSFFAFPRRLHETGRSWLDPQSGEDAAGMRELALSLDRLVSVPSNSVPAPKPAYKLWCFNQVDATYDNRWHVNGEVYTGAHATGQFVYTIGASNSLGVGYSVSGNYGSFSQSGTASASTSTALEYPTWGPNAWMATQTTWQYQLISVWVTDEMGINPCWVDHYEVRPSAFQGGISWYSASPLSTPYCTLVAGGQITKDSAQAMTFTNGVDLNVGAVGAYLSGQTGFNTQTKISFNFTSTGSMCGDNPAGYPSSARVATQ